MSDSERPRTALSKTGGTLFSRSIVVAFVYAIFFLSGAAALIYQVVWVRSLSLVFGGSHLAVTTVLAVFMAGLAIGSYLIGRNLHRFERMLFLYGLMELGIALFALASAAVIRLYPLIYPPLAGFSPESPLYLSFLRVTLAVVALIVPTTLMGGTLPVLSCFTESRGSDVGKHLSFLYGFNTFGAVAGAAATGFVLLRFCSVSSTFLIAVLINASIGLFSILLQKSADEALSCATSQSQSDTEASSPAGTNCDKGKDGLVSTRLVLLGIGVSGFCALGYEVVWTRILSIVIGASVYGFTVMLVSFLVGIAAGSTAYGFQLKAAARRRDGTALRRGSVIGFGVVQVAIGVSALVVSLYISNLPVNALFLQKLLQGSGSSSFASMQGANFVLAFSYMFVPAFLMGAAFPLAARAQRSFHWAVGQTVGKVQAYNTVGAILGAALSGFVLVYLLGIERTLQLLILVNIGYGLVVIASVWSQRLLTWGVSAATLAATLAVILNPGVLRLWNSHFLAIYRANEPLEFNDPEKIRQSLAQTRILYYGEGVESIVSSISTFGKQSFLTNGRVEASTNPGDVQLQYILGYLPLLLAQNPRKVFVLGTGSGMTLGATSVFPGVESITLAEIEPKVIGVARTFAKYNHDVINDPKLKIVFNDGRNFLMTTREKYDVITADPIHPWFSGAGYLYSTEYFKLAAAHLNPGGVICQWLPLYELTDTDLRSVVRTLREHFPHTMIWKTHSDAALIGSQSPLVLDEAQLEKRMSVAPIGFDLDRVMMGSAEELLSYFLMGDEGSREYSRSGMINTDDNVYLEFSAPFSMGNYKLTKENIRILFGLQEDVVRYLHPADEAGTAAQRRRWAKLSEARVGMGRMYALFYEDRKAEFLAAIQGFSGEAASFAPWRFLLSEYVKLNSVPLRLLQRDTFPVLFDGKVVPTNILALASQLDDGAVSLAFMHDNDWVIYGNLVFPAGVAAETLDMFALRVMESIRATYQEETARANLQGLRYPPATELLPKIKRIVGDNFQSVNDDLSPGH